MFDVQGIVILDAKSGPDPLSFTPSEHLEAIAFTLLDFLEAKALQKTDSSQNCYLGLLFAFSCSYFYGFRSASNISLILIVKAKPYGLSNSYAIKNVLYSIFIYCTIAYFLLYPLFF
jgi:hypothetical protein